jgi:hypothetical protein
MPSRCVNKLGGRVLLLDAAPEEVNEYVRKSCREYYEMQPGFIFQEIVVLLRSPMLVGLQRRRRKILLPFSKPCLAGGTVLYEVAAEDEDMEYLRQNLGKSPE